MSNAEVIAASREFVCIRPCTYESAEEAKYLRAVFSPRGGLENTVFAILDPTGTKYLAQPGRGPYDAFPGCDSDYTIFSKGLKNISADIQRKDEKLGLPTVSSARLALNVAACDNQPLAIIFGNDEQRTALKRILADLAWRPEFVGKFVFCEASAAAELSFIRGDKPSSGILLVQPGDFGVDGTVISAATAEVAASKMADALIKFKSLNKANHDGHMRFAVKQNIRWKPAIAVEDKQAQNATDRLWGGTPN